MIRKYKQSDSQQCRHLFETGLREVNNSFRTNILKTFWKPCVVFGLLTALASILLSLWAAPLCLLFMCLCISFVEVKIIRASEIVGDTEIDSALSTDLADFENYYMDGEGSCMWVAELRGQVVGMVALVHTQNHDPGTTELQRMSVAQAIRGRGVAAKLIKKLVLFARWRHYNRVILGTKSSYCAAVRLYHKCGFKLIGARPMLNGVPHTALTTRIEYLKFELQL